MASATTSFRFGLGSWWLCRSRSRSAVPCCHPGRGRPEGPSPPIPERVLLCSSMHRPAGAAPQSCAARLRVFGSGAVMHAHMARQPFDDLPPVAWGGVTDDDEVTIAAPRD